MSITPGTAANEKALVLDGSGAIATINSLTATNIYGSIKTAAQPSITSVGTLSSLTLATAGTGLQIPSLKFWDGVSAYFTFGTGGSTVYRLRTDSGVTESALGPTGYSVSAVFGGYIAAQAMAMTSDRRLKKNIQVAPLDRIKRLNGSIDVCLYDKIESENRPG
ncbi:hypothetical protein PI125_g25775 [Phytophthora idaei]|nr:hypothetical protein PI125_g25775 [Phytophthora idaei]